MQNEKVYLKQNVVAEPLYNQWYAWAYLLAPSTAPMFVANSHLKVMQSFVTSPQMHVAALKNPAMMGGPFINYPVSRAGEVKTLLEKTTREQADLLQFAQDYVALDKQLSTVERGSSLEGLYETLPATLKGYVELIYDLNHNPAIRFIEGLLYKSPFYKEHLQSIGLYEINDDTRSFVMSTPRLESDDWLQINLPFRHPAWDELFKMRDEPQPLAYIQDLLGVRPDQAARFASLFTSEAPVRRPAYTGTAPRVRYFGHACVLVETAQASVLFDPVISYNYPGATSRFTIADLPEKLDCVAITHNHSDHLMFETLLQLRPRIQMLAVPKSSGSNAADPSLKLLLQNLGFKNVVELDEMETLKLGDISLTALPFLGEHADLNIRTKLAYRVEAGGKSVMAAADSNNLDNQLYKHLQRYFGPTDILFVGMECDGAPLSWLYGPLLTSPLNRKLDGSRRLNGSDCARAWQIVQSLEPRQVYVYAMGQEPWLTFITSINYREDSRPIVESDRLVRTCKENGLQAERLFGHKELLLA